MNIYGRIYKITNSINNKVYIGLTTRSIELRFREHIGDKRKDRITGISRAMRKHGYENFSIEEIAIASSKSSLLDLEKQYISTYTALAPNGYNLTTGGELAEFLPETIKKIKKKQKGRKFSEEHLKNLRESYKTRKSNPVYGRKRDRNEKRLILKKKGQYHPFNIYDKNGKYLDTWEFISECKEKYKMSDSLISMAIQDKIKHAKGYFFRKVKDCQGANGDFKDIDVIDYKLEKKISMLKSRGVYKEFNVYKELTGELVGTWSIKSQCARKLGLNNDYINFCLTGKRTSHRGYTFKYTNN